MASKNSTVAGFSDLPAELLNDIATYLHDSYPPDLHALSLTCQAGLTAAEPFIFQSLHLTVSGRRQLRHDVHQCIRTLRFRRRYSHVRRLTIAGIMPPADKDDESRDTYDYGGERSDAVSESVFPELRIKVACKYHPEVEAEAWSPLVTLFRELTGLADLVFACQAYFPPDLLQAMNYHQPPCRLHITNFKFRDPQTATVHADDVPLIKSPCLYEIQAQYSTASPGDSSQQSILDMTYGISPNLRVVSMSPFCSMNPLRPSNTQRRPGEWEYQRNTGLFKVLGGWNDRLLESLSLQNTGPTELSAFVYCSVQVDYSRLRQLCVGGYGIHVSALSWLSKNVKFSRLEDLDITLHPESTVYPKLYRRPLAGFILSLPPLKSLRVDDVQCQSVMQPVFAHHQTLVKLDLHSSFSGFAPVSDPSVARAIRQQCPQLEILKLGVRRVKTGIEESSLYREVGRMKLLREFHLSCEHESSWTSLLDPCFEFPLPGFEMLRPDDKKIRDDIGVVLAQLAVDATLARAIWDAICRKGSRLQYMDVRTSFLRHLGDFDPRVRRFVYHLARRYEVRRIGGPDNERIVVEEPGRSEREKRQEEERRAAISALHCSDLPFPKMLAAFRQIWPRKESSRSWHDDWSSVPLDCQMETAKQIPIEESSPPLQYYDPS